MTVMAAAVKITASTFSLPVRLPHSHRRHQEGGKV